MSIMTTKYAFLDTNIFLHYATVDQIDWRGQLNCGYVVLVVLPVVIRQLNNKKDSSGSRKLRDRAGAALKRLNSYSEQVSPIMIRDGVELRFQPSDPQIDFVASKLSREVSDDWVIASILEFKIESQEDAAVLVTGDVGLKVKAKTHDIQSVRLHEQYKLPEEEDQSQKRIRELEEQIRQLESGIPRLKLVFKDEANLLSAQFARTPDLTGDTIRRRMEEIRGRYPKVDTAAELRNQELALMMTNGITSAQFDEYNIQIAKFWAAYEKHLQECAQFLDARQRRVKLELFLVNDGSCPAEDIDAFIHFPDGVDVYEERELPQPPEKPAPPAPPKLSSKKLGDFLKKWNLVSEFPENLARQLLVAPPKPSPTIYSNASRPYFQRSRSCDVRFKVKQLKHYFHESLSELYVSFPSWETVKSFEIDYSLLAANIPQRVKDTLRVVVEVKPE